MQHVLTQFNGLSPRLWRHLLFAFSTLIFTLSFYQNVFRAADSHWFKTHQADSEALVIGRLVESDRHSLLSREGRLGTYGLRDDSLRGENTNETYLYLAGGHEGVYRPYNSQIGFQGFFFSVLDQALRACCNLSAQSRLNSLHLLASLFTALSISLLIHFIAVEFGIGVALATIFTTACSQWLVVFGKNLYWSMFLMFLPIALSFFFYLRESQAKPFNKIIVFTSLAFLVFLKCASGFEYITTIAIGMALPVLYYAIQNAWSWLKFIREGILVSCAVFVGFLTTFFVHVFQQSIGDKNTFFVALSQRFEHAMHRLHMKTSDTSNEVWLQAADASIWEVLAKYWHGHIFNFSTLFNNTDFILLEFNRFVFIVLIFAPFVLVGQQFIPSAQMLRRKMAALLAITAVAFIGTLSWFILAKVHSYFHGHMNHVLWHMPFSILGTAYVVFILRMVLSDYKTAILQWLRNRYVLMGLAVFMLSVVVSIFGAYNREEQKFSQLFDDTYRVYEGELFDIYFNENAFVLRASDCAKVKTYSTRIKYIAEDGSKNILQRRISFKGLTDRRLSRFSDTCISEVKLTKMILRSFRVIDRDTREAIVELKHTSLRKQFSISAFPLSDHNWTNGVSPYEATLFVENNARNRMYLRKNRYLNLNESGKRRIRDVQINKQYINVYFYGDLLYPDGDGYPHPISASNN